MLHLAGAHPCRFTDVKSLAVSPPVSRAEKDSAKPPGRLTRKRPAAGTAEPEDKVVKVSKKDPKDDDKEAGPSQPPAARTRGRPQANAKPKSKAAMVIDNDTDAMIV